MNDRLLSLLGIARRAGRLTMGFDPVVEELTKRKAKLVLTASDLSPRTLRDISEACAQWNTTHVPIRQTMDEIHMAVGKRIGVMATTDPGFARSIKELCRIDKQEESHYGN